MERDETILDELINFEQKKPNKIPQLLDDYLKDIAKTGEVIYPWKQIRPLFTYKLQQVLEDFHERCPTENLPPSPNVEIFKYETMKDKLVEATCTWNYAPFTIQRLCELITDPNKHYKQTDKFMRGIEKNMLVVSASQPSRRNFESFEHQIPNGAVETLSENGCSSVQLDSFVSTFSPGNERLHHSLSDHSNSFNSIEAKSNHNHLNNDLSSSNKSSFSEEETHSSQLQETPLLDKTTQQHQQSQHYVEPEQSMPDNSNDIVSSSNSTQSPSSSPSKVESDAVGESPDSLTFSSDGNASNSAIVDSSPSMLSLENPVSDSTSLMDTDQEKCESKDNESTPSLESIENTDDERIEVTSSEDSTELCDTIKSEESESADVTEKNMEVSSNDG